MDDGRLKELDFLIFFCKINAFPSNANNTRSILADLIPPFTYYKKADNYSILFLLWDDASSLIITDTSVLRT